MCWPQDRTRPFEKASRQFEELSPIPGLIYVSESGTSGYASSALSILKVLHNQGVDLCWRPCDSKNRVLWPTRKTQIWPGWLTSCLGKPVSGERVLLHVMPSLLPALHQEFSNFHRTVYTVWETEEVPASWVVQLNLAHRVLVPTRWNRDRFRACGVTVPIDVMPYVLPEGLPTSSVPLSPDEELVFYSIGEWTARKSLHLLVEAYLQAFARGDRTCLVIKTSVRDLARLGANRLMNVFSSSRRTVKKLSDSSPSQPRIRLLTGPQTQQSILDLHARSHCFVSLCRSEGWGLGAFEAAGSGNPVVITGYGGHTEFLQAPPSYLLDYSLVPCEPTLYEPLFDLQQRWAKPDMAQAVGVLREIRAHPEVAFRRGRQQAESVRQRFSEKALAPLIRHLCCEA